MILEDGVIVIQCKKMRYITIVFFLLLPLLVSAQASGGQIKRNRITAPNKSKIVSRSPQKNTTISNKEQIVKNLIKNMVYVEGGTFIMGATNEQIDDAYVDEYPVHEVTLSSFFIGKYEVTQEEWQLVMGNNPSDNIGKRLPVEKIDWYDCHDFIEKLNMMTGKNFRLPTEAEWEFAARGGIKSQRNRYSGSNQLDVVAWFIDNSSNATHNVGLKSPNELGLYDMTGNVWEWCEDRYGEYDKYEQFAPIGPPFGSLHIIRGGGWESPSANCRTAVRRAIDPRYYSENIGFRLVLEE